VNIQSGDNATQLSDIDRSEIVTTNEKANPRSEVNLYILKCEVVVIILQWFITFVKRDEYHIRNRAFASFVCYDNRPQAADSVLSKRDNTSIWRIRRVPGANAYYT
jgi:hypothetical protein